MPEPGITGRCLDAANGDGWKALLYAVRLTRWRMIAHLDIQVRRARSHHLAATDARLAA